MKYLDVFKYVNKKISEEFGIAVYSDEVSEGFKMPCFFVKLLPTSSIETKNTTQVKMTIVITFLTQERNQIVYLNTYDRMNKIFDAGFSVGDRYIHVEQIQDSRTGEFNDILQIEIDINYFNKTKHMEDYIAYENDDKNIVKDIADISVGLTNENKEVI